MILLALLAAPLAIGGTLALVALERSPLESAQSATAIMGPVQSAESWNLTTVVATLRLGSEREVTSQASGVLTDVSVAAGIPVATGDQVFAVDGAPVIAYVAPYPLYRDIGRGISGDDVRVAQELLVAMGYLDSADGLAGPATRRAIIAFNAEHGHGKDNETLSAQSLLWIPENATVPKEVTIHQGDTVAAGSTVWVSTWAVDSVVLETVSSDVDRTVTIGDATVPLAAGETIVTAPADIAALKVGFATNSTAVASLRDATPTVVGAIPSAAIVTAASGSMCFLSGAENTPVPLASTGGAYGMVFVDHAQIGVPVLLNPYEVLDEPTCDSISTP